MTENLVLGLTGSLFTLILLYEMLRRRRLRGKYAIFWTGIALGTLTVTHISRRSWLGQRIWWE